MIFTIDFETEAIVKGSDSTPTPVGVSIKHGDAPSEYLCWRHPTNNNSTFEKASKILHDINRCPLLFHNAKFDVRIMMEHFNIRDIPVIHDTMLMAYIIDPRESSLCLKQLADKYLDMPPDEQTELKEWIVANVRKATEKTWGEYISHSPGDLAGKYAEGDTDRTYLLCQKFLPIIKEGCL